MLALIYWIYSNYYYIGYKQKRRQETIIGVISAAVTPAGNVREYNEGNYIADEKNL